MTAATTIIDAVRIAAAAADRVKANDIVPSTSPTCSRSPKS